LRKSVTSQTPLCGKFDVPSFNEFDEVGDIEGFHGQHGVYRQLKLR